MDQGFLGEPMFSVMYTDAKFLFKISAISRLSPVNSSLASVRGPTSFPTFFAVLMYVQTSWTSVWLRALLFSHGPVSTCGLKSDKT